MSQSDEPPTKNSIDDNAREPEIGMVDMGNDHEKGELRSIASPVRRVWDRLKGLLTLRHLPHMHEQMRMSIRLR